MTLSQRNNIERMKGVAAPMWLWVFAVVAVGSFVILVSYLDRYQAAVDAGNNPVVDLEKDAVKIIFAKPENEKAKVDTKTHFDFYKLLPELESVIPDFEPPKNITKDKSTDTEKTAKIQTETTKNENTAPVAKQNGALVSKQTKTEPNKNSTLKSNKTNSSNSAFQYFLQTGSFKEYKAADRMKANLAFIGIKSNIQKVNLGDTGVWHRVRLGPFKNVREMRGVKGRLQASNIKSIMLKVKS